MKKIIYFAGIASCLFTAPIQASSSPASLVTVEDSQTNLEKTSVEEMVEKLFLRLDVRHREILSIEENITHNRSSMEKESLSRILEQKVRDFVKKDAMVANAIDRLKNSADKDNVFLYRKSMDRLDHYRKNIDQIQQLYFRKPLVVSPEIKIETGNENFENFLSSWESKKPIRNTERRSHRSVIPNKEVDYFTHVKNQKNSTESPKSYVEFLDQLNPDTKKANQEVISKSDKASIDKFHERLTKETRSGIPRLHKDQSFSNFFERLEKDVTTNKKDVEISQTTEISKSPFDVHKRYLKQLDEPAPQVNPLKSLMSDLDRMTAQKKATQKIAKSKEQGRSFSKFYDQLELSKSQKNSKQKQFFTKVESDKEFDQFVANAEKSIQKGSTEFKELHKALANPVKATDHETLKEKETVELTRSPIGKARTSFMEMFASIPSERIDNKNQSRKNNEPEPDMNTNRFRVILNSLKKDNQKALLEAEYIDGDEKIFEKELAAVFPDKVKLKDAANADIVKSEVVRFDHFPGNIHGEIETDKLEMTQLGPIDPLENNQELEQNEESQEQELSEIQMSDTPLSSSSDEGLAYTDSESNQDAVAALDTSEDLSSTDSVAHDGKIHPRNVRLARQAEARLLRKNASLIPIVIETRDKKDRLYSELPIEFKVEMEPRNFITGHILNSYVDSPWRHTVKTNTDGIAAVHLLLDLKGKEVNISRTLQTSMKRTICKVLITPKY